MSNNSSELSAAPLGAFKATLRMHLKNTLDDPTPASEQVQQLLVDLDKASEALEPPAAQEVRNALESIQNQHRSQRANQLAEAICEIANKLGIMIQVSNPSKRSFFGGSLGSEPRKRYTPEQRQQITQRITALLQSHSNTGISKAELAKQLGLTPNQIKRILLWPEVQELVAGTGSGRQRRYVLKASTVDAAEHPAQGDE